MAFTRGGIALDFHTEMAQWVPLTLGYELYHCFAKSLE